MGTDTVYIVDPDPDICASLNALLSRLGYDSEVFHCGKEFLEHLKAADSAPHGCIISEMTLPDVSGFQLMDELQAADIALPVIILTADTDVSTAVKALHRNAANYFVKPYTERALVKGVRKALESY